MGNNTNGRCSEQPGDGRQPRGYSEDEIRVAPPSGLKRTVGGTSFGNLMEWYGFGIFAFLVPALSQVFFPASGASGLLATFAMFAAAFVIRPIGGLVFGMLGDRIGRKGVLATTMITMALATLAIGLLPSYATIGIWAPILLLVARLVQGFSTGGEYAGAMTYLGEHAPDTQRGFLASWLEFSTLSGYVLGAAIVTGITALLSEQALTSWGWRIPFLLAGPLGLIGLYVRTRLEESPAYEQYTENRGGDQDTLGEQFRNTVVKPWRLLLICAGLVLAYNVTNYMLTQYMPTYLSAELGVPKTPALMVVLAVMLILMVLVTFAGRFSDWIGRKPLIIAGCVSLVVLSAPAFLLIAEGSYALIFPGVLLIGLMLLCFSSTIPSTLPALFPTSIRYGSLAIGFNNTVAMIGGTTPLIAESLVSATGSKLMPAILLVAAGGIGAVAIFLTQESAGRPLPGESPTAANKIKARERSVDSK
jgi:MFS transporter, MHS family, proline/betaine transporter